MEDSKRLKFNPRTFEKQRGDYPVRREFPVYTIIPENVDVQVIETLRGIGFKL